MAWTTLTAADVKTKLTGPEVSAVQTAALASGQSDPLVEIVEQVVDEVRGYIAAGGYNLGDGTTVPSKLVSATLSIIRYRLATRLPVKTLLTTDRVEENKEAIRLLERVADGKFVVEEPTTVSTESLASPTPSMTSKTLTHQNSDGDGL
jgi:phage gp36-like protein